CSMHSEVCFRHEINWQCSGWPVLTPLWICIRPWAAAGSLNKFQNYKFAVTGLSGRASCSDFSDYSFLIIGFFELPFNSLKTNSLETPFISTEKFFVLRARIGFIKALHEKTSA